MPLPGYMAAVSVSVSKRVDGDRGMGAGRRRREKFGEGGTVSTVEAEVVVLVVEGGVCG